MAEKNPIDESASVIRRLWDKHGIKKPMRLLGFCLSLLPVPIIQQAGQTLDRHLSDKDLQEEMESLWGKIAKLNEKVDSVETLEAAISEVAKTVELNSELRTRCGHLSSMLASKESLFTIETEDHSYQELVRSLIKASRVHISATNASTNAIQDSQVHSPNTHLHASGGSSNFIDRTQFIDRDNSVGMQGISTKGDIHVTGKSVGFGAGGALIFGGNPNLVSGNCPICQKIVEVDKRQLKGYTNVQCPHCNIVLPFNVG